ncbi:uncharacterized protein [Triticum aestivum]|uniref:uncharacterized protein n=1 Tax=Triticum aestivum TaxID=4565 RepID=UPI001D00BD8C|nr:uncharacterized protein LOC123157842 [Triticum aestivum]
MEAQGAGRRARRLPVTRRKAAGTGPGGGRPGGGGRRVDREGPAWAERAAGGWRRGAKEETEGKVREAQRKKDLELAEKIKLVDEKLASVTKLEQENATLKAILGKKNDLEVFLSGLAKKLFIMLEEFCQNFEEETSRLEPNHDPVNSPIDFFNPKF